LSEEKNTTMEGLIQGRTMGAFRCLNCFKRVSPQMGAKEYKCPHCGYEWRVFWISADVPRIRGPVWDTNRRMAEEDVAKAEKKGGTK
jgi:DNA-directed RNA polymerase subunit RPC12/RpoP